MEWELWACSCPAVSEPFHPLSLLLESALGEVLSQGGGSSEEDTTVKGHVEKLDCPIFDSEPVGDCGSACTLYLPDVFLLPIWLPPPVASLPCVAASTWSPCLSRFLLPIPLGCLHVLPFLSCEPFLACRAVHGTGAGCGAVPQHTRLWPCCSPPGTGPSVCLSVSGGRDMAFAEGRHVSEGQEHCGGGEGALSSPTQAGGCPGQGPQGVSCPEDLWREFTALDQPHSPQLPPSCLCLSPLLPTL